MNRIKCGEEILSSGEHQRPIKFIVDSMMSGCPKSQFKSKGFIAKEVSAFVNGECAKCDKREICIGYIAEHVGRGSPEEKQKVLDRMDVCLKCKDLDNCIHYFMTQLGISKYSLIKNVFLVKYRRCSSEKMMKISLDLPADSITNVGGTLKQGEKP